MSKLTCSEAEHINITQNKPIFGERGLRLEIVDFLRLSGQKTSCSSTLNLLKSYINLSIIRLPASPMKH